MEAAFVVKPQIIKVPRIKVKIQSTAVGVIEHSTTPPLINITLCEEPDYSETQFYADLTKASKQLDAMVKQALEEHAQGKTRKFPE